MIWIVVLQMFANLVLFAGLAWLWHERRTQVPALVPDPELSGLKLTLERRIGQMEEEMRKYTERAHDQIKQLSRITEEAARILKKAQAPVPTFSPSAEECELKAALTVESSSSNLRGLEQFTDSSEGGSTRSIPTLTQLERTRQRLKSDISVDLRTLLRDQLA